MARKTLRKYKAPIIAGAGAAAEIGGNAAAKRALKLGNVSRMASNKEGRFVRGAAGAKEEVGKKTRMAAKIVEQGLEATKRSQSSTGPWSHRIQTNLDRDALVGSRAPGSARGQLHTAAHFGKKSTLYSKVARKAGKLAEATGKAASRFKTIGVAGKVASRVALPVSAALGAVDVARAGKLAGEVRTARKQEIESKTVGRTRAFKALEAAKKRKRLRTK